MIDTLFNHRSIRKFKTCEIENTKLDTLLEAATRASNTGNMQAYSIVVTRDAAIRKQLWEAHFKQDMVLSAPVHLTFCSDFNRFSQWCTQRNADPGYDNYLSFLTGATDALLAAQNAVIAAESLGLGACYLGTVTWMADHFIRILELPKLVVPVAAIVMGYPDETPALTDRLPVEGVVHYEKYQKYSPSAIDSIHAEKEALESTLELIKINGKETLAQIFTDNRYTRADNRSFSRTFLKTLAQQDFMSNED
ncbi:MAG: nitroreductase family protein [Bacteroidales bacterium]|nr:nitroreductase family protein [Bacteroidales bacterium]